MSPKHLAPTLILCLLTVALQADYFTQPTETPDKNKWQTGPAAFPPIEEIAALPGQDRPVYGIYLWGSEYERAHKEIEKMGVRSLRISGPAYEADEALKIAAKNDVEVMYTVDNQSVWPEYRKKRKRPAFDSDEEYQESIQKTYIAFLDKYGPNGTLYEGTNLQSPIAAIEVLNEPNYQYVIPDRQPRAEVEAEREALYAKVLPAVSEVVRNHPNSLPLVGFSCGGGGSTRADYRFVEGVYENGGDQIAETYDIFSTHPYTHGAPPEAYKIKPWGPVAVPGNTLAMRELLDSHGGLKPIWWTEVGYEIGHEYGGKFKDKPGKEENLINPDQHAAYVIRTYLMAMRQGVQRVHIMHLHDTDNYNSGIIDRGTFAWRPTGHAIKNITTLMPNAKLTSAQSDGENDTFIYEFIGDHTQSHEADTIVAWSLLGPQQVEIDVDAQGDVTVYDMVGNEKQVPVKNGKVSLEIGPYPIYIKTDS
ncbi:hypothetical protein [Cerasicoccus fimbriatus]|uniref:hypothetical protein n=1 Tax=Cerasicoccus fimbriatus TaxID=3014554 RepID=UPI0022B2EF1E|nr:hypothetical protein [Cerasicoccus sp. TK19100]